MFCILFNLWTAFLLLFLLTSIVINRALLGRCLFVYKISLESCRYLGLGLSCPSRSLVRTGVINIIGCWLLIFLWLNTPQLRNTSICQRSRSVADFKLYVICHLTARPCQCFARNKRVFIFSDVECTLTNRLVNLGGNELWKLGWYELGQIFLLSCTLL